MHNVKPLCVFVGKFSNQSSALEVSEFNSKATTVGVQWLIGCGLEDAYSRRYPVQSLSIDIR